VTRLAKSVQAVLEEVMKRRGVARWGVVSLAEQDLLRSAVFQRARLSHARFLEEGMHATMGFLERRGDVRERPGLILENARSAIVVAVPYGNDSHPEGDFFRLVARYAWYRDYHKSIRAFLEDIGLELQTQLGDNFSYRAIVDSVPFWERAVAEMGGLGSVGKNTCLIAHDTGSFVFLGTLLTSLSPDDVSFVEGADICGDCMRCQGACPTRAFVEPYRLDARRCLAYWSIEHRGPVPDEFVPFFARTVFGCDICQSVCPHNRKIVEHNLLQGVLKDVRAAGFAVFNVAAMTERQYEEWFGGTSLTRAKYEGLVRNALYHLYAVKSDRLDEAIACCLEIGHPGVLSIVDHIQRLRG
jgi:epoxyqueuosine reductase